jgi:hypothetical protein
MPLVVPCPSPRKGADADLRADARGRHGNCRRKKLLPLLRQAGGEPSAPTQIALGEHAPPTRPDVPLTAHVEDVMPVMAYEELHDLVLVETATANRRSAAWRSVRRSGLCAWCARPLPSQPAARP